jgi:7,8-dihydropterin-6-yl-methyl-4-(beta-D-ribofuranosyl)aminobenzene 5'-phosphate synthase
MGIDLKEIDVIVLSHGHQDHTGGLREILRRRRKETRIIAHPDIWQAKYSRRPGRPDRYSGIPFKQTELESLGGRFQLRRHPGFSSYWDVLTGVSSIPYTRRRSSPASRRYTPLSAAATLSAPPRKE